ncbi:hypothetical protein RhiirA4_492718 [Rhizophagus irregularis]|uniref:Uncharacterized protein n=1 Tax=Rhizophagus irregularis TaxID=588596 RepID=A0A2I1HX96_9GLOM|nr:hypothetical protein RhiirA4_492718 [Rhizophagus irregularis]
MHGNTFAFGGVNIIVVGDLVQLPPVTGHPVFHVAVWSLFFLLFLKSPQRQNNDMEFYLGWVTFPLLHGTSYDSATQNIKTKIPS